MADALSAARKDSEKKLSELKEEKEAIRGQAVKLKEKVGWYMRRPLSTSWSVWILSYS